MGDYFFLLLERVVSFCFYIEETTMKVYNLLKKAGVIKIIENEGFDVHIEQESDGSYFAEFNQYTPAGEDWHFNLFFNGTVGDFVSSIKEYAFNYEAGEDLAMWIEAKNHGSCSGIPSIEELYEDAKWKESTMDQLYQKLW